MGDEASGSDDFDWVLESSKVRSGNKIPIPKSLRDQVCIDGSGDPATWWGYDTETGFAFLSSGYSNDGRYLTVKNRSYKLEKGSRVTIPKPESEKVEEGVLFERPDEKDTVYFYSDSRMKDSDLNSVFILSKDQMEDLWVEQYWIDLSEDRAVRESYDINALVSSGKYMDEESGSETDEYPENSTDDKSTFYREKFSVPE